MQTLLDIIIRVRYVLLFVLLEMVSFALLFRYNNLQNQVLWTAANSVCGSVSVIGNSVTSIVGQRKTNLQLAEENAILQSRLLTLQDSLDIRSIPYSDHDISVARVVNNTIRKDNNYITIDRGQNDGLTEGMGVYSSQGAVGVIYRSGRNYSLVMPLINVNSNVSCMVKRTGSYGILQWRGGFPHQAWLSDVPYHSGTALGDTVVTSGFSEIFPKNIPVGVVSNIKSDSLGFSPKVTIDLFVDFSKIDLVYVKHDNATADLSELYMGLE